MERSRVKCGQYWPMVEDKEEQHGEFLLINTGVEQRQDYTITGLFIHNTAVSIILYIKIGLIHLCYII